MRLQWEDQGEGSFYACDEATGLSAQVDKFSIDPEKPFIWFIADLPSGPEDDQWLECFDGCAATAEEAMACAEDALPSVEVYREWKAEVEQEWEEWHKARKDAAPYN